MSEGANCLEWQCDIREKVKTLVVASKFIDFFFPLFKRNGAEQRHQHENQLSDFAVMILNFN
jgi:hypothetical protein